MKSVLQLSIFIAVIVLKSYISYLKTNTITRRLFNVIKRLVLKYCKKETT